MDKAKLHRAVAMTSSVLVSSCAPDNHDERLEVLMHMTAAALHVAKKTPEEVSQYLIKITTMLDGEFDR